MTKPDTRAVAKAAAADVAEEVKRAQRDPRPVPEHQVLLAADQLCWVLGRSRSGFYRLLHEQPTFPKPVQLSKNSPPQWIRAEVVAWIASRPRIEAVERTA